MEQLIASIVGELDKLLPEQVGELNESLVYDTVERVGGEGQGNGANINELASALNSILYLEDQELLYDAIANELGGEIEINDKPNSKRVKRPNGGNK